MRFLKTVVIMKIGANVEIERKRPGELLSMYLEQKAIDYFQQGYGLSDLIRRMISPRDGDVSSRKAGSNMEFEQYRDYVPGDDPRGVDWKVYARSDRLFVRTYGRDVSARVRIVLDTSASMDFRQENGESKFEIAKKLTALLAWLLRKERHTVRFSLLSDDLRPFDAEGPESLETTLSSTAASGVTDFAVLKPADSRETGILITDGWGNDDGKGLRKVADTGYHLFHLLTSREHSLRLTGDLLLRDIETASELRVVPSSVRERYRMRIKEWLAFTGDAFRRQGSRHFFFPLEQNYYATLMERLIHPEGGI